MSLGQIEKALLQAYTDGEFNLETQYENMKFNKPSTLWAAVYFIANTPSAATLGERGRNESDGTFQINLVAPAFSGKGALVTKADELETFFRVGRVFEYGDQRVKITGCGYGVARLNDNEYTLSVTVTWYAQIERGV